MIRLRIIGEGLSEATFAQNILIPHLALHYVFANSTQIITSRPFGGAATKGGIHSYNQIQKDIKRSLDEDTNCIITTMLDVYALPYDFPQLKKHDKNLDPYEKVTLLEKAFAEDINNKRFIPYLQLHEFETLFFSNVSIADDILSLNTPRQLKRLQAILKEQPNPELINDSPETAPSKRILKYYPHYRKGSDSIRILQRIPLNIIRRECRHFDSWISRLESLSLV